MKDGELSKSFPRLTIFKVEADGWTKKFSGTLNQLQIITRAVVTLESSLSIRSVSPFLEGQLRSIDFWNLERDGHPERYFNSVGMLFADTGQIYNKNTIEQFQEDYLIARLAGLRQ